MYSLICCLALGVSKLNSSALPDQATKTVKVVKYLGASLNNGLIARPFH